MSQILFWVTAASLWLVAAIHLLPLSGVTGAAALHKLYGIELTDHSLIVLMRHRAVLFGIFGAALIAASFNPQTQIWALVAGFIAVISFLFLANGASSQPILRVVLADKIALVAILLGVSSWLARHIMNR